jgi:tetratricopeptide (TPR) repeat protein
MHDAVESLNTELEARFLIRLALHIGVNTGEVSGACIGNASTIASGEAVNLAARLQQLAPSGATVIGDETYRLVRDHVVATPLERVALKGKASPIPAWHVTGLRIHSQAHHLDIPFVGRTDELDHLMWVFRRVLRDGACYIASVLGDAGIGKSKLVHEFLRRAQASHGATRVIVVRCPRYGDGGPFAPLGDIFKQVLNQEGSGEHLATAVGKGAVKSILSLAGSMDGEEVAGSATETFWLVRKVLEMLASTSILLVVIEDLHWAKPGFLDLVESLGRSIREAPVVFLCTARPELLEHRPSWGGGSPNTSTFLLPPLSRDEAVRLAQQLGGVLGDRPPDLRLCEQIADAGEGNALFIEQLVVAFLEGRELTAPPGIRALIAARLDQLDVRERTLVERAAIVGKEFSPNALQGLLTPQEAEDVADLLLSLTRKCLINAVIDFGGTETYRFRSSIIRDVAYAGVPKRLRAELHERFARCLQEGNGGIDRSHQEAIGYHLEQAFRYRIELGMREEHTEIIAQEAARYLEESGVHALSQGDVSGAKALLNRSLELYAPENPARLAVMTRLGETLIATGEVHRADSLLHQVVESAPGVNARAHAYAILHLAALQPSDGRTRALLAAAQHAIPLFESQGDRVGLAKAWNHMGVAHQTEGRYAEAMQAFERALQAMGDGGSLLERANALGGLGLCLYLGPTPIPEALPWAQRLHQMGLGSPGVAQAAIGCPLALLLASVGRFIEARQAIAEANTIVSSMEHRYAEATILIFAATVEELADQYEVATQRLREACTAFQRIGDRQKLAWAARYLARVLVETNQIGEALDVVRMAEEEDAAKPTRASAWSVRARALGGAGRLSEALDLGRAATAAAAETDSPILQASIWLDLALLALMAGRHADAQDAARRALHLFDVKGHVIGARRARAVLERQP